MRKNREELEQNQLYISLASFLADYNQNLPTGFPRATPSMLRKFQEAHPTLFKNKDLWSVGRHRKRLIDWMASNGVISSQ